MSIKDAFTEAGYVFLRTLDVYRSKSKGLILPIVAFSVVSVGADLFFPEKPGFALMIILSVLFICGFAISRNIIKLTALQCYSKDMKGIKGIYSPRNATVMLADIFVFLASTVLFSFAMTIAVLMYAAGDMQKTEAAILLKILLMLVFVVILYVQKYANTAILLHNPKNFMHGIYLGLMDIFGYYKYTAVIIVMQSILMIPTFFIIMNVSLAAKVISGIYTIISMPVFIIPTVLLTARIKGKKKGNLLTGFLIISALLMIISFFYSMLFPDLFSYEIDEILNVAKRR